MASGEQIVPSFLAKVFHFFFKLSQVWEASNYLQMSLTYAFHSGLLVYKVVLVAFASISQFANKRKAGQERKKEESNCTVKLIAIDCRTCKWSFWAPDNFPD